jgi:hypothetical protein
MARTRGILLCAALVAVIGIAAVLTMWRGQARDGSVAGPSRGSETSTTLCRQFWSAGLELKGVVGGRDARGYFDTSPAPGDPEGVSGIVVFPGERGNRPLADTPIGVAGMPSEDGCSVQLREPDADAKSAVWTLRMESTERIRGIHDMHDGRTEAVAFEVVAKTACDGAGEWRTFSAPEWPITFDYPATWVLTSDDDDVNLECPSLEALASGGTTLTFERGRLPSPVSGKVAARKEDGGSDPFWFVRGADGRWRVSDRGCADAASEHVCAVARRSERNRMTVLQGIAGEHRLYRPGVGYLGQGFEISRYLFLFGDQWISLDNGDNEHGVDDFSEEGGPVLLDGNSVGDRVVRSVRLR